MQELRLIQLSYIMEYIIHTSLIILLHTMKIRLRCGINNRQNGKSNCKYIAYLPPNLDLNVSCPVKHLLLFASSDNIPNRVNGREKGNLNNE